MSKVLIILLIISSFFSFSKSHSGNFKIELAFKTMAKGIEHYTVIRDSEEITYNSMKMTSERFILAKDILGYLLFTDIEKNNQNCNGKQYKFLRHINDKVNVEIGCLYSERFTQLLWAFETI